MKNWKKAALSYQMTATPLLNMRLIWEVAMVDALKMNQRSSQSTNNKLSSEQRKSKSFTTPMLQTLQNWSRSVSVLSIKVTWTSTPRRRRKNTPRTEKMQFPGRFRVHQLKASTLSSSLKTQLEFQKTSTSKSHYPLISKTSSQTSRTISKCLFHS